MRAKHHLLSLVVYLADLLVPEGAGWTGGNTCRFPAILHPRCAQVTFTHGKYRKFHSLAQNTERTCQNTTSASCASEWLPPDSAILITCHRLPRTGGYTGRFLAMPTNYRKCSHILDFSTLKRNCSIPHSLTGYRMRLTSYAKIKLNKQSFHQLSLSCEVIQLMLSVSEPSPNRRVEE